MTAIDVEKNPTDLSLTLTAHFDAPPERVWQVWSDPRQLERWWGPPSHPATVVEHELVPGGAGRYYMTGPEGERYHGWWRFLSVDAPHSLEFEDGFADAEGHPNPDMPTMVVRVSLAADGDSRTRMSVTSVFPTAEAMDQLAAMGMVEGMSGAISQIPAILAGTGRPVPGQVS